MAIYFPVFISCSPHNIIGISKLCCFQTSMVWNHIHSSYEVFSCIGPHGNEYSCPLPKQKKFLLRSPGFCGQGNYDSVSFYWQGSLKCQSSGTLKCLADSVHPQYWGTGREYDGQNPQKMQTSLMSLICPLSTCTSKLLICSKMDELGVWLLIDFLVEVIWPKNKTKKNKRGNPQRYEFLITRSLICEWLKISYVWLWDGNFMISKLSFLPSLRALLHYCTLEWIKSLRLFGDCVNCYISTGRTI